MIKLIEFQGAEYHTQWLPYSVIEDYLENRKIMVSDVVLRLVNDIHFVLGLPLVIELSNNGYLRWKIDGKSVFCKIFISDKIQNIDLNDDKMLASLLKTVFNTQRNYAMIIDEEMLSDEEKEALEYVLKELQIRQ